MGFTKNWKQMTACRILLGLLEAGKRYNPSMVRPGILTISKDTFPAVFTFCLVGMLDVSLLLTYCAYPV